MIVWLLRVENQPFTENVEVDKNILCNSYIFGVNYEYTRNK